LIVLLLIVVATVALLRTWRRSTFSAGPTAAAIQRLAAGTAPLALPKATDKARNASGTVQVCGIGALPTDPSDSSAIWNQVGALTKGTADRWLMALQNSDDVRARISGLLLEGKLTGDEPPRPVTEQTPNDVVQLAAGSTDPAVYALAYSICNASQPTLSADNACHLISLPQWTRLDPDNAVPWLIMARKAQMDHDDVADAEAFSHAAAAHKFDSYTDSVLAFATPEMPSDATPLERSYLATAVIGIESAIRGPYYSGASQHCAAGLPSESVRHQCGALAELMVTRGTNFLDMSVGTNLGARVGWSRERLNQLTQERSALMWTLLRQSPADKAELWSCDGVNHINTYITERVQRGELGTARETLERSGESSEALADQYTQYMEELQSRARATLQQESADATPN
jgi:hypothetical protein